jgi:hypothetical protein
VHIFHDLNILDLSIGLKMFSQIIFPQSVVKSSYKNAVTWNAWVLELLELFVFPLFVYCVRLSHKLIWRGSLKTELLTFIVESLLIRTLLSDLASRILPGPIFVKEWIRGFWSVTDSYFNVTSKKYMWSYRLQKHLMESFDSLPRPFSESDECKASALIWMLISHYSDVCYFSVLAKVPFHIWLFCRIENSSNEKLMELLVFW